ncbi:MFS transporter [Paenibacillus larvae]
MKITERTSHWADKLKRKGRKTKPLPAGWKGASIVLGAVTFVLAILQANYFLGTRRFADLAVGIMAAIGTAALIGGLLAAIIQGIKKIPGRYLWLFFSAFPLLFICFIGPPEISVAAVLFIIIILSLWGAILYKLAAGDYKNTGRAKKIIAIVLSVTTTAAVWGGGYWFVSDGSPPANTVNLKDLKKSERYVKQLLQNPAEEGPYKVKTLTYGSKNSYRGEFNKSNSLITKTVDGSAFVENWSSLRTKTVGFGPDAMPLNGLIWYPEGEGPFPLVVMVHGNYTMTDYSDPGYEYLGQLLASRGYIFVSIDENFLNVSPYDDMMFFSVLEKENPARGMLMLEHIKTWKEWNSDHNNPFYEKADMNQIALMGHSRGGEAVAIAAAFNKLNRHPDDGNIKFDYNFNIRSLVSIAGTDKQYQPEGKELPLQDVNYLALHGAHDMDVSSFAGAKQYNRISFTGEKDFLKSSVYIYGANHGQFNRVWGRGDGAGFGNQLYNLKQLMPRAEQEKAAKVFISSFLDATLKNKKEYKQVFQDIGYAKEWLPDTLYVSNYSDSNTFYLTSHKEGIDLESTAVPGGKLIGENLQEWKAEKVKKKYGDDSYSAVRLGWDRSKQPKTASYTVILPGEGGTIDENSTIVFSMADDSNHKDVPYQDALIDLTVKVEDTNGNTAKLPLSHISNLVPIIEGKLVKIPFADVGPTKEPAFQTFGFPLHDFVKENANFNPQQLEKIHFEFDKTEKGTVLINDIGVRK